MIIVRSDASGTVFLVREGEEPSAFQHLAEMYPGWPIVLLQKAAGLVLVRVSPDGAARPPAELSIGRVVLSATGRETPTGA